MRFLKSDIELYPADLTDFSRSGMFISLNLRYLRNLQELYFRFKSVFSFQIQGLKSSNPPLH